MLRRYFSYFLGLSEPDDGIQDDESMQSDPETEGTSRRRSDEDLFNNSEHRFHDRVEELVDSRWMDYVFRGYSLSPRRPRYPSIFAVPPNIVRSYEKTKRIWFTGGTMTFAGFSVEKPTQVMRPPLRIKLKLKFFDVREDEGFWTFFGPEVDFEPNEITFREPVLMTIPTCYVPINSLTATVRIQAKIDDTWEDSDHSTVVDRKINFSIREFTPLRFLMRIGDFMKTIAHMLYIRQEKENEYEVIWCFYDDLMETRLETEKLMELRDFTPSGITGTFLMRHTDVVKVALEIPDCGVENPTRNIPTRDLWSSDAIVQVDFNIKNLGDRFNIKDITGKITAGENEIVVA